MAIRSWFGHQWTGRFVFHLRKPALGVRYGEFQVGDNKRPLLVDMEASKIDIEYVDEEHMAIPFMHTMESPFESGKIQMHYHKQCSSHGIHSCSIVCDMSAQLLLNTVYYGEEPALMDNFDRIADQSNFSFCLSCPVSLNPFTVNVTGMKSVDCLSFIPKDRG